MSEINLRSRRITGCDTRSSFYGIGKTSIFKHFMQYEELKEISSIFLSTVDLMRKLIKLEKEQLAHFVQRKCK